MYAAWSSFGAKHDHKLDSHRVIRRTLKAWDQSKDCAFGIKVVRLIKIVQPLLVDPVPPSLLNCRHVCCSPQSGVFLRHHHKKPRRLPLFLAVDVFSLLDPLFTDWLFSFSKSHLLFTSTFYETAFSRWLSTFWDDPVAKYACCPCRDRLFPRIPLLHDRNFFEEGVLSARNCLMARTI